MVSTSGSTLPAPLQANALSDILIELDGMAKSHVSIRDVTEALGERSFGASLAVFALPNLMPLPPGSTIVFGIPLLFVTWQMMMPGNRTLRFPSRMANYRIDRATFSAFAGRAVPLLRRVEKWMRPRLPSLRHPLFDRMLGAFALLLAIAVFLPIPLGNWLPALALMIIGLTMAAGDGLALLAGVCIGIASIAGVAFALLATGAVLSYFL